jgi:uncharacterized protein with FMN-binding domain
MAGLARRLAPAAALGSLAVIIVGVADPALAGRTQAEGAAVAEAPVSTTTQQDATQQDATQPDTTQPDTTQPDTTTQSASSCASGDTVDGAGFMTPWGPVQVQATVADGQICEVHAVAWPANDRKSQMINAYAVPQLDAMASASPTAFDYVSGATYTSTGYHDSVQSILDSL